MSQKKHKVFSLQEADELLPELRKRLDHLRLRKEAYSRIHDALFMHELVCAAERANGFFEKDDLEENVRSLEQAVEDLAKDVEAIFDLGCMLRNIEKGRIEFPATLEGKKVFWSWEQGEPSIRYFRPLQASVKERLPIPDQVLIRKTRQEPF